MWETCESVKPSSSVFGAPSQYEWTTWITTICSEKPSASCSMTTPFSTLDWVLIFPALLKNFSEDYALTGLRVMLNCLLHLFEFPLHLIFKCILLHVKLLSVATKFASRIFLVLYAWTLFPFDFILQWSHSRTFWLQLTHIITFILWGEGGNEGYLRGWEILANLQCTKMEQKE